MAKMGVNARNNYYYLKATGLNRPFISFGDYQLRYKGLIVWS